MAPIFVSLVLNKLSNNESEKCEGEITIEECTNAIFKMKLNKAPGLDGLSVEFYRKFWNSLKKLVTCKNSICTFFYSYFSFTFLAFIVT
jgi:hypothetical protein